MLLPPSEPITRKPPVAEAGEPVPASESESSAFRRLAGWVRTGMDALLGEAPTTAEAALAQDQLAREGEALHQAARAGAEGRPPTGGAPGLGQRVRSWLGRVRSWMQRHLPPRRQDRYLQALEALRTEMRMEVGALRTDVKGLQASIGSLNERVGHLETGQAEMRTDISGLKAGQTEMRADISELKAGQAELQAGQAEMRTDISELKAGQAELQAGQAEMRTDISELKAGQAELRTGQAELLDHARTGIGMVLQSLCHEWATTVFPRFWHAWMSGCPDAPHPQWVPSLRPSLVLWHDRLDDRAWDVHRDLFDIPGTVPAHQMQTDLLTRMEYALPNGEQCSFLLLGEVARQADLNDIARLLTRKTLLRDAGVEVPIVPCLFAQDKVEGTRAHALLTEHNILHMFRGGRSHYHRWQEDAQVKLRRLLGWEPDAA